MDHTKNGEEFIFPVADGTAKLSGRDHDFREVTPRTKSQGQTRESRDDADARGKFLIYPRRLHLSSSQ